MFLKELLVHMLPSERISIYSGGEHKVTLRASKAMPEGYGDLIVGLVCAEKEGAFRVYVGGDFSNHRMAADDDDLELQEEKRREKI